MLQYSQWYSTHTFLLEQKLPCAQSSSDQHCPTSWLTCSVERKRRNFPQANQTLYNRNEVTAEPPCREQQRCNQSSAWVRLTGSFAGVACLRVRILGSFAELTGLAKSSTSASGYVAGRTALTSPAIDSAEPICPAIRVRRARWIQYGLVG